jgi:hypothetical protein
VQLFSFKIKNHSDLLIVKKLPDFEDSLEMLPGHFVEMAFLSAQLFLILLFEHLEIEFKEPLDFRRVLRLQTVDV